MVVKTLHKFWFWSLMVVLFSQSLDPKIQVLLLVPFVAFSTFYLFLDFSFFKKYLNLKLAILFCLLFSLIVVGLYKSFDISEGLKFVERNLSFLIMPLFFAPIIKSTTKEKTLLLIAFQLGIIFTGLICLGNASYNTWVTGSTSSLHGDPHFAYNYFMSHSLTDPFGVHPIYQSLVVLMGSVSLLVYAKKKCEQLAIKWRVIIPIILVFHLIMILLFKSALFSTLYILSTSFTLIYLGYKKIVKSKILMIISIILLIFVGVIGVTNSYSKIESLNTEYNLTDRHLTPLKLRLALWECAMPLFQKHWIAGVGTGNLQSILNEQYQKKEFKFALIAPTNFNTHNQYLQYGISYGIIAPILFLLILITLLMLLVKKKNLFGVFFLLCFSAFSLTESTLEVQKGILLFTCFVSILFYSPSFWQFNLDESSYSN